MRILFTYNLRFFLHHDKIKAKLLSAGWASRKQGMGRYGLKTIPPIFVLSKFFCNITFHQNSILLHRETDKISHTVFTYPLRTKSAYNWLETKYLNSEDCLMPMSIQNPWDACAFTHELKNVDVAYWGLCCPACFTNSDVIDPTMLHSTDSFSSSSGLILMPLTCCYDHETRCLF
jgi:hypothetical protein